MNFASRSNLFFHLGADNPNQAHELMKTAHAGGRPSNGSTKNEPSYFAFDSFKPSCGVPSPWASVDPHCSRITSLNIPVVALYWFAYSPNDSMSTNTSADRGDRRQEPTQSSGVYGSSFVSRPWVQLGVGVVCMAMVANLQFGWTIFVNPIDARYHFGKAAIQVAFTLFILFQTWLLPLEALSCRPFWSSPSGYGSVGTGSRFLDYLFEGQHARHALCRWCRWRNWHWLGVWNLRRQRGEVV